MDPDACLKLIEEALADDDRTAARQHAEELENWIAEGGFEPSRPWKKVVRNARRS